MLPCLSYRLGSRTPVSSHAHTHVSARIPSRSIILRVLCGLTLDQKAPHSEAPARPTEAKPHGRSAPRGSVGATATARVRTYPLSLSGPGSGKVVPGIRNRVAGRNPTRPGAARGGKGWFSNLRRCATEAADTTGRTSGPGSSGRREPSRCGTYAHISAPGVLPRLRHS